MGTILYLTARSVGQADTTRQYLQGVNQDGIKLPPGPVILSPDRTFAALRREVVLKKPEVFKMACLSDIKNLFLNQLKVTKMIMMMITLHFMLDLVIESLMLLVTDLCIYPCIVFSQ